MFKINQPGAFAAILRNLLLVFLVVTFGITAGAMILRYSITSKLDRLSSQLEKRSRQPSLNGLLVELNMAETSFQKSTGNGNESDLAHYKRTLKSIFAQIEAISVGYRKDSSETPMKGPVQLATALQQKLAVSQQLFELQRRFDSLLRFTTISGLRSKEQRIQKPKTVLRSDTLVQTREERTKASLIQRLGNAFRNRNSVKVMTIRERAEQDERRIKLSGHRLLDSLSRQYAALSMSNQQLILANMNLLSELRRLLTALQQTDQEAYEKSREQTLRQYQLATRDLNTYTTVASCLVLLFIVMLVLYIRRASFAERRYKVANSRALSLAGQKSEILAIMSHEIRNKLMAINGAVYMLNKTTLSQEQDKKIKAIDLSSSMMLETVNNVLDMSKLEQQPVEINVHEFSPKAAIADSVEAMRFMAEKKNIDLLLHIKDEAQEVVKGDSFRLKQVLINLLSNAIKYTDSGVVAVSVAMSKMGDRALLNVSVKDTGPGIPKSRQSKLFSAYYQAGGQKPGTGLGLYLCRQLIRRQGGEITLESTEGEGCTFSFHISYDYAGETLKLKNNQYIP